MSRELSYRSGLVGTLHALTGIDDPYAPRESDLVLGGTQPIADGVAALEERDLR